MKITIALILVLIFSECDSPQENILRSEDLGSGDLGFKEVAPDSSEDLKELGAPEETRPTPEICDNQRPVEPIFSDGNENDECSRDSDCKKGKNGRCRAQPHFEVGTLYCTYDECFNDDDCGQGTLCSCGKDKDLDYLGRADENQCVPTECLTDADCGAFSCKPDLGDCQDGRVYRYRCTTAEDECRDDADCFSKCTYFEDGKRWVCSGADCD